MTSFIIIVVSLLKRFCKMQRHAHEDPDRLHKVHAMYTFAEVSILEFDPALGMECHVWLCGSGNAEKSTARTKRSSKTRRNCCCCNMGTGTRRSARATGWA
ncbi:hypothetical protein JOM56_015199 [Amanita muscaria]